MLLVEGLDVWGSRFWAEVNGVDFIPTEVRVQTDIFSMFSEKPHYVRTWREDLRREQEKQMKKAAIERAARERARRLNK